jgi:molecular chaperone GrpE (heat shock protein)
MLKKCAIFGLIMMLVSAGVVAWIFIQTAIHQHQAAIYRAKYAAEHDQYFTKYNQLRGLMPEQQNELTLKLAEFRRGKTPQQLFQEQKERLKADIDRLAAKQMDPGPAANMLYGPDWKNKVAKYAKRKELYEIMFTGSTVFAAIGALIFAWCVLLAIVRLIIRVVSMLYKAIVNLATGRTQPDKQSVAANTRQVCKQSNTSCKPQRAKAPGRKRLGTRSRVLVASGWHDIEGSDEKCGPDESQFDQTDNEDNDLGESDNEESLHVDPPLNRRRKLQCSSGETSPQDATSFTTQTEDVHEQIEEIGQTSQTVQQAVMDQPNPINNTLKELTEQISAIREYAACQQDRVERLQDGYDWNIIKNFCLRLIRCIDNIETRITRLAEKDIEVRHLKEVRDELVFALESSGIEKFEPKLNSDYYGQEKIVEAVKEKVATDDSELVGKIAQVVRPGYQYIVHDDSIKIIRAAQVKLFG